jgi:hypothetical protein
VSRPGAGGPLLLRVAVGDIVAARASLLVVSHLNGVRPSGAEAAADALLDGAIARRAATGSLDGPFGAGQFIPAASAPVAADAVLVLSLGEPGRLDLARLPELGAAIADAAAATRARDVATVVHGAGGLGVPIGRAARALVQGLLAAMARQDGPRDLREVVLVTRDAERAGTMRRALAAVEPPPGVEVVLARGTLVLPDRRGAPADDAASPAKRVHLGITRAGEALKVTLITEGAFDAADNSAYPTRPVVDILRAVQDRVLAGGSARTLATAMQEVGAAIYDRFLAWPRFGVGEALQRHRGDCVLLRLDESTVDLPWELAFTGGRFLGRGWILARQREISAPGHPAAYVAPHDRLRALVIGDPTGNLPGARAEADFVAGTLARLGAEVHGPAGVTRRAQVLEQIDRFNPDVLHYAGHARFDPLRQQAGGLVLADGTLTADDLAVRARVPRLFFANGCNAAQTGDLAQQQLSDGTAPTNDFAGGVLRAGARAMVGSQWVVEDRAARTFAEHFYTKLAAGDQPSIGEAVQAAREATATLHRAEPAWAAYALYGTPWKTAL